MKIELEEIGDGDSDGSRRYEVGADGISVGFVDIVTAPYDFSEVTMWKWNGNFAPDSDWPQEDDEPGDTDQLMEDIAKAIRCQLTEDVTEWSLHGVDKITAKASPAATI